VVHKDVSSIGFFSRASKHLHSAHSKDPGPGPNVVNHAVVQSQLNRISGRFMWPLSDGTLDIRVYKADDIESASQKSQHPP
jgi:hypothetical protein